MLRRLVFSLLLLGTGIGLTSCLFMGPSLKGDGNVVNQIRETGKFENIKATTGINVVLVQGDETKVEVVADKNLQKAIETNVSNRTLQIRVLANIRHAKEKKVIVTVPRINEISATAGSNVNAEGLFISDSMSIKTSAGSNVRLNLDSKKVQVSASAGSNLFIEGTILRFTAKLSSGSNLKAEKLTTEICEIKVSSGANAWITVNKEFSAQASSGGNVFYYGQPTLINSSSSSGGNIIKK